MFFWNALALSVVSGLVIHTPNLPDSIFPHVKSSDVEAIHPVHGVPVVIASPIDACIAEWDNSKNIFGKIVLIERGICSFNEKIIHAQNQGAVGVIVYNNIYSNQWKVSMYLNSNQSIRIPAVFISKEYGTQLQKLLKGGPFRGQNDDTSNSAGTEQKHSHAITVSITSQGSVSPHHFDDKRSLGMSKLSIYSMIAFYLFVMGLATVGLVVILLTREDKAWRKTAVDALRVVECLPSSPRASKVTTTTLSGGNAAITVTIQTNDAPAPAASSVSSSALSLPQTDEPTQAAAVIHGTIASVFCAGDSVGISDGGSNSFVGIVDNDCSSGIDNDDDSCCSICLDSLRAGGLEDTRNTAHTGSNASVTSGSSGDNGSGSDRKWDVLSLPCGHCFHRTCISEWLLYKSLLCPLCKQEAIRRKSLDGGNLHAFTAGLRDAALGLISRQSMLMFMLGVAFSFTAVFAMQNILYAYK